MKRLFLLIAFVCLAVVAQAQIPTTAGWYEIPNTQMRFVCQNGDNTCGGIVEAWGSAVLDSTRNRLIVWGGGHNDYYGNELYALNLSETPAWQRITNGCFSTDWPNEFCSADTNQPQSRHTYDFIEYMPNVDRLWSFTYAWSNRIPAWTFNFANSTWAKMMAGGVIPNDIFASGYDPQTGNIVFGNTFGKLGTYNFSTNTYALLSANSQHFPSNSGGVVARRKFIAIGGGWQTEWNLDGPNYDPQNLQSTGGDAVINASYPAIDYDPVNDRVVAWAGGDTVYSLNLDTKVWTPVTYTGGPGPAAGNGTNGRWRYVPALGAFVLVNSITQNAYIFRLSGSAPPPPPPPPSTLTVGPGKMYATICAAVSAAQSGNTLDIDAGDYVNESCVINKGLTLKGIGGRFHMKWGTGDSFTHTSNIPNGKAMLIVQASVTIDGGEFSGAKVSDQNGAGIRYESGDLTIRNSYFHGNENGILGQGGSANTLLIEHSIFDQNGYCPSSCGHNLYIGTMGKLVFRHNKTVNSRDGSHTLKSRALVNEVLYNFISTKNSDGSYEADFPNGGTLYFIGNVVEQGANTGNSSILAYGAEGATNPNPALYVVHNTFNNLRSAGATFIQVAGSPVLGIRNNVYSGGGTFLSGATTDISSNKDVLAGSFVNATASDYHLVSTSAAVNVGIAPGVAGSYSLTPVFEYVEAANKTARILKDTIDVGAYEFQGSAPPACDLQFNVSRWPAQTTGSRSITYSTNKPARITFDPFQTPWKASAVDSSGCTIDVTKP